ncbi:secreted phosphoprotein 24 isoform X2 [Mastacembelus armatus]|uniref:secreted phosphoprotein 24 isoform X2 n=1 Tax=Mastacembelus armatus TaxID=205130 RepID=UPI000E465C42|nr:secreted phosphoprotein 24 isoform X2 [Mastacembelus armatus]
MLRSFATAGVPLYNSELQSMAERGLGAALAEVNSVYAISHFYRATRGSIKRLIPVGLNTVDLLMVFGIKETVCVKSSTSDPQTCAFRPGFFVPTFFCSSRVRMSATSAQVISLRCGHDTSSSSESSEEVFSRGRHLNIPFSNRVPAPRATPPPQPVPSEDTLSNYLLHSPGSVETSPFSFNPCAGLWE